MRKAIEYGPGVVRVGASGSEAAGVAKLRRVEAMKLRIAETAGRPAESKDVRQRAQVVRPGWSRRARGRMLLSFLSLDLAPLTREDGDLVLVTLTLPRDWQGLAPSGAEWMRLVDRFLARMTRAFPGFGAGLIKTEFQRRGAPHLMLLTSASRLPGRHGRGRVATELPFRDWVAVAWADVVGARGADRAAHEAAGTQVKPWEGDPVAAVGYFAKYAQKAWGGRRHYQDEPPELWRQPGAGLARVWSHRGMQRRTTEELLSTAEATWAQRVLRRWYEAQGRTVRVRVQRGRQTRWVTRRSRRLRSRGGWLAVPDGPSLDAVASRAARLAAVKDV